MDNNTKPEVKEPVKSEAELKKEKWKKFVFGDPATKEKKPPLDKQDKLCYAGAVFFLLLAFVPMIMRTFDPNYSEDGPDTGEEEVVIQEVIKKMNCNKHVEKEGYIYLIEVTSTYKNNSVQISEIKYSVTLDAASGLTYEDARIEEYDNIIALESKGIANHENINVFTVKIDYRLDGTLRNNEALSSHNKMLQLQRQAYQNENYSCNVEEGKL